MTFFTDNGFSGKAIQGLKKEGFTTEKELKELLTDSDIDKMEFLNTKEKNALKKLIKKEG